ncbi:hypothetical protein ACFQS4_00540, partial [Saliphagus sp. GCM10025317]
MWAGKARVDDDGIDRRAVVAEIRLDHVSARRLAGVVVVELEFDGLADPPNRVPVGDGGELVAGQGGVGHREHLVLDEARLQVEVSEEADRFGVVEDHDHLLERVARGVEQAVEHRRVRVGCRG